MSWIWTILGIMALIVLHELGHFTVAKAVGMRVERFSLFFPPTIVARAQRARPSTRSARIPLGGYVKITGMNPEEIAGLEPEVGAPRLLQPGAVEADRGDPRGAGREHR